LGADRLLQSIQTPNIAIPRDPEGGLTLKLSQARHVKLPLALIDVPVFEYLPFRSPSRCLDAISIKLAVIGDLDRAQTRHAETVSSKVLIHDAQALRKEASIICLKGFDRRDDLEGFRRLEGFPCALLKLAPDYWASLGSKRRSDLRRQQKAAKNIRRVRHKGLPAEYAAKILELYHQTRNKADLKLLKHGPNYFVRTADVSTYLLYFLDKELVGFHQLVCLEKTLYSQYVGMDYSIAKDYRLYFNMLIDCIDYGLEHSFAEVDFGITSYRYKLHLGCELRSTWNYFQLTHPLLNRFLPLLDAVLSPKPAMLQ
jgi:hypothetical protein